MSIVVQIGGRSNHGGKKKKQKKRDALSSSSHHSKTSPPRFRLSKRWKLWIMMAVAFVSIIQYVKLTGHITQHHDAAERTYMEKFEFLPPVASNAKSRAKAKQHYRNATILSKKNRKKDNELYIRKPNSNVAHDQQHQTATRKAMLKQQNALLAEQKNATTSTTAKKTGRVMNQKKITLEELHKQIDDLTFDDEFFNVEDVTENRPYFILHVGPPKTATTSIQCGLNVESGRLASDDNYYYLGRSCPTTPKIMDNGIEPIIPLDFINQMSVFQPMFLNKTRQWFVEHLRQGHSAILSTEHVSSKGFHQISHPLLWRKMLRGFRVKIVIAYRHYFEWYPSFYYQSHLLEKYRTKWPGQDDGQPMPNLIDYIERHLDAWEADGRNNLGMYRNTTHMSLWMYLHWSRVFDDVQLLDLHYPGDVFNQFVCQALPGANTTCDYLHQKYVNEHQNTTSFKVQHRVSSNHFGNRVVDAALEQGMIPNTKAYPKKHFSDKAKRFLARMELEDDPEYRWCPSPFLENRIRNASLTFLEVLHSKRASEQLYHHQNWTLALQEHDELFWNARRKHKFCDINTTRVLLNVDFVRRVFQNAGIDVLRRNGVVGSDNNEAVNNA